MTMRQYLDDIDFWVTQEKRTVTYRWLSSELRVPCDTAKRMLFHYADTKKRPAVYYVAGVVDGDQQALLVPTDKLEEAKSTFQSIATVHVYAVTPQKTDGSEDVATDSALLWGVDYQQARKLQASDEEVGADFLANRFAQISCDSIELDSATAVRRPGPAAQAVAPKPSNQRDSTSKTGAKQKKNSLFAQVSRKSDNANTGGTAHEADKKSSGSLGRQQHKSKKTAKDTTRKPSPERAEQPKAERKITGTFTGDVDDAEDGVESMGPLFAEEEAAVEDMDVAEDAEDENVENNGQGKKEDQPGPKKRKRRIKQNVHVPGAMEDFVTVSDEPPQVVLDTTPTGKKRTMKKLVERTYEDKDGYLVTSNEWVEVEIPDESQSDSQGNPAEDSALRKRKSEAEPVKSNEESTGDDKAKKRKSQKSLTSFFGRR